jgi:predicted nucleotidyltransferase
MQLRSVQTIFRRLNEAGVRYVVVGGLAVVVHGYQRFTSDVDLMLDLDEDNVRRALEVLKNEGFAPRIPVPMEMFADAAMRESWVRDKNMLAYGLDSEQHRMTHVDLFVKNPVDFEATYAQAVRQKIGDVEIVVISLDGLIYLKELAGRTQDKLDVENLRRLQVAQRQEAQRDAKSK